MTDMTDQQAKKWIKDNAPKRLHQELLKNYQANRTNGFTVNEALNDIRSDLRKRG